VIPEEDHNSNFKPSDLGQIPPHWLRLKLKNICSVRQGLQIPIADRLKAPTKTSKEYITIQSINRKNQEREYVESPSERVVCSPEDILMTRTGNTGIVVTDVSGAFHNNFFLIDYNRNKISKKFLVEYLRSRRVQHVLLTKAGSSTIPDLNHKDFYSIDLPVPPLSEQKKIAQILSTWDKAIETVEKLIANSQQKKKALMQQLLTGKKRFPGFDGEWEEVELSQLCKFMKGQGLSKGKLSDSGQFKCILYGELYTRYSEVISSVVNRTNHNEGIKSESGDVLIPASTTTSGIDLANATSLKEGGVLLSGDINILRTDKNLINPDFLAYVLTHVKKYDLARRAQGITIIHLYGKDIKHIKIALPSLLEQGIIVATIASVEAEIGSRREQLEFLRIEKKALMQQLLTGKRRVKVDEHEC